MKLNKQTKDELRAKIVEQLKEVPIGQMVKIDKETLEDLLFETITVDKERCIQVKLPVWSGEFLRKIDLSQVDFTNVSWSMLGVDDSYVEEVIFYDFDRYGIELDEQTMSIIKRIQKDNEQRFELANGYAVGYFRTNARIDLSKSFEAIHGNEISIRGCDFGGLDFSQQDLSNIKSIFVHSSNLYGTKLPIGNITLEAWASDFNGIDLSTKKIDAFQYILGEYSQLAACDLTNCGVQITLDVEKIRDGKCKEELKQAMNEDWIGCYVNGKKVLSPDEKQKDASKIKTEYEKMKEEIFTSVLGSIEEQKNNMKK